MAERGALAPTPPPASPNTAAGSNTDATPDYSINDLAAAMAAARQLTASTYQQCNCSFISPVICPCARNAVLLPARESFAQLRCARHCALRAQGDTFLALERDGGAPAAAEAPAKKEVREIEFFPAASAHHTGGGGGGGGRVSVRGDSELAAPFSSPYGAAAAGRTAPQLDLSLRL